MALRQPECLSVGRPFVLLAIRSRLQKSSDHIRKIAVASGISFRELIRHGALDVVAKKSATHIRDNGVAKGISTQHLGRWVPEERKDESDRKSGEEGELSHHQRRDGAFKRAPQYDMRLGSVGTHTGDPDRRWLSVRSTGFGHLAGAAIHRQQEGGGNAMNGSPFQFSRLDRSHTETMYSQPVKYSPTGVRCLLNRDQVLAMLQLSADEVQHLVDTQQVHPIRIEGHERFCSIDIGRLIDHYVHTARRAA